MLTREEEKQIDDSYRKQWRKFNPTRPFTGSTENEPGIYDVGLKFGDFFLFEIVAPPVEFGSDWVLTYPRLGCFSKYDVWDQALALEWMEPNRTWMDRLKYTSNPKLNIQVLCSSRQTEIFAHAEWSDTIIIHQVWKQYPSKQALLEAYRRTLWFRK